MSRITLSGMDAVRWRRTGRSQTGKNGRVSRLPERLWLSFRARDHTSGCAPLLQLRVFGLGSDEDGNVRVGVFPEGEEILIRAARFAAKGISIGPGCRLRLKRVGARKTEVGQCAQREVP